MEGFGKACRSIDEFQRLNRIDEGTFGVVYRAKDKATGEIVALKRVKVIREAERDGFPVTALREMGLLVRLNHVNVLSSSEVVIGGGLERDESASMGRGMTLFSVLEFMEHDLEDLMQRERAGAPWMESEVKCLMKQLLEGVAYLHENWIVHRDLKPANLLMNNQGILKIADLGLARDYCEPVERMTPGVTSLWYRAPEVLLGGTRDKSYGKEVDMWSVGCIFAQLMGKGEPVLPGTSELGQLELISELIGSITERTWPGYREWTPTPDYRFKYQPNNNIRARFPYLTDAGVDLLNGLLKYDPSSRLTARQALAHEYFAEPPYAKDPAQMPTYPSAKEGTARPARAQEDRVVGRRVVDEELAALMAERSGPGQGAPPPFRLN